MIAYVKGTIADITEDIIVVDVNGIGYNVRISKTTAAGIPGIGEEVKLHTYTLIREDAFQLYGFLTKADLEIFKMCITVSGIGPKVGLALLSIMDADALCLAIISGDAKAIAKAPGIGAKTAERLILELKGKISVEDMLTGRGELPQEFSYSSDSSMLKEAVEALVALGYGQAEAAKAVRSVEGAEQMESGVLLKAALKKIF